MEKTVIVVGGDGFCGWPLSLKLSNLGFNVHIVDNFSRRKIDEELGSHSLIPIYPLNERVEKWQELTGKKIEYSTINVAEEYEKFCQCVRDVKPNVIIHLGEQRAAPYSMKNSTTRRYTVNNNLNGTNNIVNAIVDIDKSIHLIHLGSMGVYGYGTVKDTVIPEGYVNVKIDNGRGENVDIEILHPSYPGSVYHMTKTQDALFFQYYAKNYNLRITDLHQGIIWGASTKETSMDPKLANRFDYDSDYGTVLNRFIIQSAIGHPLTIYGTGEQTRAFIHIEDSMKCIVIAINNPPNSSKVSIFNQLTETHRLLDLAELIKEIYPNTSVNYVDNPRNELKKNSLVASNKKFLDLGLDPIFLNKEHINEIYNLAEKYRDRLNKNNIIPMSFWK
jgi:UDP-sulfoquinovose synthase